MSEERKVEAAYAYAADLSAVQPWHGRSPDEEVMEREEGESLEARRAGLQQHLMVYLFADGRVRGWQCVALRALAVMRIFTPVLLAGRCLDEVGRVRDEASLVASFPMETLRELTEDAEDPAGAEREAIFLRLMQYFFRAKEVDAGWLQTGTLRIYLVARQFMPWLVAGETGEEMTYERLAWIFGEIPHSPEVVRAMEPEERAEAQVVLDRGRSRMSARAQKLIRLPIEKAGGKVRMTFGKRDETRAKYAEAARGNRNRRRAAPSDQ